MDTFWNLLQHAQGIALCLVFLGLLWAFLAAVMAPDYTERADDRKAVRVNSFNQEV